MILGPSPLFGRSPYYKGPVNYVAIGKTQSQIPPAYVHRQNDFAYRVSANGRKWFKALLLGDIVNYQRTDGPAGLVFEPTKIVPFKGKLIAVGRLVGPQQAPYIGKAGMFISADGYRWDLVTLTNDNLKPSDSGIMDAAADDDWFVAVGRNGVLFYWNGTGAVQSRTDLPIGQPVTVHRHIYGVNISAGGVVITGQQSGSGGEALGTPLLISATAPNATFTARSLPTIDGLGVVARGNLMMATSQSSVAPAKNRVITAPLNNLTTWTAASGIAVTGFISLMLYKDRWIGGDGYNKFWIVSVADGTNSWGIVNTGQAAPWGDVPIDHPQVNSGLVAENKFVIHWGFNGYGDYGGLSLGSAWDTWERLSNAESGLAARAYLLGSRLAA